MASRWLTTGDEVMINSRLMCCGDDRLEVSESGEWEGAENAGKAAIMTNSRISPDKDTVEKRS
jgi:uncharacterized protein with NRDE domain